LKLVSVFTMEQNLRKIIHIVSVSGGKDSTVTCDIAIERVGKKNCRLVYCDTGNENPIVYDYLDDLEVRLGVKIERLKADFSSRVLAKRKFIANDQRTSRDKKGQRRRWSNKAKRRALAVLHPTGNPFLDLCLWRGRFPSRKGQFCTQELKTHMLLAYQSQWLDEGYQVISWQGVRRDESAERKNAKKIERLASGLFAFRPLVEWTAEQVFAYHHERKIKPNPLYTLGMSRVGCMPCINVNKGELREISSRFPDVIERVRGWELMVGQACKMGFATMMCSKDGRKDKREIFADLRIDSRVRWSKTRRGGKQFDLMALLPIRACSSAYGLCE